jgi:hypothetical protein
MKTAKPRKSRFHAVDEAIRAMVRDAPPPSPGLLDTIEQLKKAEPCKPTKAQGEPDAD